MHDTIDQQFAAFLDWMLDSLDFDTQDDDGLGGWLIDLDTGDTTPM